MKFFQKQTKDSLIDVLNIASNKIAKSIDLDILNILIYSAEATGNNANQPSAEKMDYSNFIDDIK